jgi:hypothetical protein
MPQKYIQTKFSAIQIKLSDKIVRKNLSEEELYTGFIIGKCENVLILTFVLLGEYTALALVFTAKTIVRKEDISNNSLFFLAGTMINVTYSIIIGLVVKFFIGIF